LYSIFNQTFKLTVSIGERTPAKSRRLAGVSFVAGLKSWLGLQESQPIPLSREESSKSGCDNEDQFDLMHSIGDKGFEAQYRIFTQLILS